MLIKWAHLSDIHHMYTDYDTKIMRDKLIEYLKQQNNNIDLLFLTGDIAHKGSSYGTELVRLLDSILSAAEVEKHNVFIVPGNHDIKRSTVADRLTSSLLSSKDVKNEVNNIDDDTYQMLLLGQQPFFDFYKSYLGEEYPINELHFVKKRHGFNVIHMNTCLIAGSKDSEGKILMGLEKFYNSIKNLPVSGTVNIAIGHHSIGCIHIAERDSLLNRFSDTQIDLYLNGHLHKASYHQESNNYSEIQLFTSGSIFVDNYVDPLFLTGVVDTTSGHGTVIYHKWNKNGEYWHTDNTVGRKVVEGKYSFEISRLKQSIDPNEYTAEEIQSATQEFLKMNNELMEVDSVLRVHEWVGREKELSLLKNHKISVLAITGVGGQGKSALASEYLRRYSRGDSANYQNGVWIDCRELPHSLHHKIIQSLEIISGGVESARLFRDEKLEETVKRLIRHLQSKKLLIVFDNIDAYVRADTEGPTSELKPFFESLLNTDHSSLVIFTSRNPIIHESAAFFHIKLNGLTNDEGLNFFQKRNIDITGENRKYSEEIIEFTHGHPWWLGLIAGQISNNRDTLKNSIQKLRAGDVLERERIQHQSYFNDIWEQLNKDRKRLLRYLVEAHRPLTEYEVFSLGEGPGKLKQELRRLERLGLVEPHEGIFENQTSYQVHPLIREFIHGTYTTAEQKSYVQKVLYIFLPRRLVDILFENTGDLEDSAEMNPKNLVDSLETCLNSRNADKALSLLERYKSILTDNGYHHKFQSLACRVLDEITWQGNGMFNRSSGVKFFSELMKLLNYLGDGQKCNSYMKRYESVIEPNTLAHLNYLELSADIAWRENSFDKAIELSYEYEQLAEKLLTVKGLHDVKYTRALAFRDSEKYVQEALDLFNELGGEEENYSTIGNKARCYFKLGKYNKSEELLRKSLNKIHEESDYFAFSNMGFAYLWLVELLFKQERMKESKAFFYLVQTTWKEYAPGLLYQVERLQRLCEESKDWNRTIITVQESKEIEAKFLTG